MSDPQDTPMAMSPALPEAGALVGRWRVSGNGLECMIVVFEDESLTPVDASVPMLGARPTGSCPGLEDVRGLQPMPLGFSLIREDGGVIGPFEQVGPDQFRSIDQVWTVSRG